MSEFSSSPSFDLKYLHGKIIYATPSSGKTTMISKVAYRPFFVDGDEILVEAIREISKSYRGPRRVSDNRDIIFHYYGKYIRYNTYTTHRLARLFRSKVKYLAQKGLIVLHGTKKIMDISDLVCIQTNDKIRRSSGKRIERERERENQTMQKLYYSDGKPKGPIVYMKNYIDFELRKFVEARQEDQRDFQEYADKKKFLIDKSQ